MADEQSGNNRGEPAKVRVPILMYHEIATREDTTSRLAVSPSSFAAQLKHLHEAGFTTLTVSGLVSALADDPARLPERPVVITFDDGFADFHSEALPLLRHYDFTATVFVTTRLDCRCRAAYCRPEACPDALLESDPRCNRRGNRDRRAQSSAPAA